jgi:hypothetical protein
LLLAVQVESLTTKTLTETVRQDKTELVVQAVLEVAVVPEDLAVTADLVAELVADAAEALREVAEATLLMVEETTLVAHS